MHIGKTGGVSVETLLKDSFDKKLICPSYRPFEFIENKTRAGDYRIFIGHNPYYVSEILPRPLLIFTFLRNPLDRTLSTYKHFLRDTTHPNRKLFMDEANTLLGLIKHPRLGGNVNEPQTRFLGINIDFSSLIQKAYKEKRTGKRLMGIFAKVQKQQANDEIFSLAKQRLFKLPFIGITERFEESIGLLCKLLEIDLPEDIHHLNRAPKHQSPNPKDLSAEELEAIDQATYYDQQLYELGCRRLDKLIKMHS